MSIFDHYLLRKFFRLIKHYTEDLLRNKEEYVEDKVDKIDSRTSRSKLLRREWSKVTKGVREWSAARIKKEVQTLVSRAQGSRVDAGQVREDLDDFLTLSRYKYMEAINPDVNLEEMVLGPPNLQSFLSFYLSQFMQDDMVTSRQFLNASVSDRNSIIRSSMTDAVEESIPASIHRAILTRKSRRATRSNPSKQSKEPEDKDTTDQPSSSKHQPDPSSQALHAQEPDQPNNPQDTQAQPLEPPATLPKNKRARKMKEVVLSRPNKKQRTTTSSGGNQQEDNQPDQSNESDQSDQSNEEPSQMDILRERLAALEERDRKLRNGTYKPSGHDHDFELNTNLSSFM